MRPNNTIHIPRQSRLDITRQQIDAIQNIAMPIGSWLLGAYQNNSPNDPEAFKRNPIAGEDIVAAEQVFIKACGRLEAILEDPKLLSMDEHEALVAASLAAIDAYTDAAKAQQSALEWSNTPAARFEPLLVRLDGIGWSAVFGDLANIKTMICGVGRNPEAALISFNSVFKGEVPEPIMVYALVREKALELDRGTAPPATYDSSAPITPEN